MLNRSNKTKKANLPKIKKVNFTHWDFKGSMVEGKANQIEIENQTELLAQGVIIEHLSQALKNPTSCVHKIQGQVIQSNENDLVAENYRNNDCGLFIYIPQNVSLSMPVKINVFQSTSLNYHLVMLVDDGSSVSVIENFESETSKLNGGKIVEEIVVSKDATLHLNTIQNLKNVTTYFKQRIIGQKDSQVFWNIEAFNLENNINESDIILNQIGAQGNLKVIALAGHNQVQGFNSKIISKAPKTMAKMLQRAIVLNRAQIVFNGIGEIRKGAHGTDLQQENRLLMLSKQARGDANPILLIDENDVQAAHAASVGKIDEKKMYYLMSRGLTFKAAQKLLIQSFLNLIILQIPEKQIRKILKKQIEERIQYEL